MGILDAFKRTKDETKNMASVGERFEMFNTEGSFSSWSGNTYNSDIVRSIIRAKARAVSKAYPVHIRETATDLKVNPEAYMKLLLKNPNELMGFQQLLEKIVTQLELNNNAFIYIKRDINGYPTQLIPINSTSVTAHRDDYGQLYLKFQTNNKPFIAKYTDIIHLRQDYNDNEIFGTSNYQSIKELMEVANALDKGIMSAIKNSNTIRFLLKFVTTTKEEDIKKATERFSRSFLSGEADGTGVAGIDNKVEALPVNSTPLMPDSKQMDATRNRILSLFNTNDKIITSSFNENEWLAYYEAVIDPLIIQLESEFTRKLFTTREQALGNYIEFNTTELNYTSIQSKIAITGLVDRGVISPNEARKELKYSPREGGDEFLLRLDTAKQSSQTTTATK